MKQGTQPPARPNKQSTDARATEAIHSDCNIDCDNDDDDDEEDDHHKRGRREEKKKSGHLDVSFAHRKAIQEKLADETQEKLCSQF